MCADERRDGYLTRAKSKQQGFNTLLLHRCVEHALFSNTEGALQELGENLSRFDVENGFSIDDLLFPGGENYLQFACKSRGKSSEVVKLLLAFGKHDINHTDVYGNTVVHSAATSHDYKLITLLQENGYRFDSKNHAGHTPLHIAAVLPTRPCWDGVGWNEHLENEIPPSVLSEIIKADPSQLYVVHKGKTPLIRALLEGQFQCATIIYGEHYPPVYPPVNEQMMITEENDDTTGYELISAAIKGAIANPRTPCTLCDIVWFLCKRGIDPTVPAANGDSVFHLATRYGLWETIQVLIYMKCDPRIPNEFGSTPTDMIMDVAVRATAYKESMYISQHMFARSLDIIRKENARLDFREIYFSSLKRQTRVTGMDPLLLGAILDRSHLVRPNIAMVATAIPWHNAGERPDVQVARVKLVKAMPACMRMRAEVVGVDQGGDGDGATEMDD